MPEQVLEGLKVVEYGHLVSAPFCAKLMADLGAEVIKVEEPNSGDESRHYGPFLEDIPHHERSGLFLYLNTSKLGVTLNVRTSTGRKILERLLEDADVFVENNPPQLMKELRLDYTALKEMNPRLIVTSITPYGQTGPYRDYKAYDINCTAAGGLSFGMGERDREPLSYPLLQADKQAGLAGAVATMFALFARDVTGQGQHVDVSETDVLATLFVGSHVLTYVYRGVAGIRRGFRGGMGHYPFAFLPCKDGYMLIYAPQIGQWMRFTEVMGTPEWTKDPRYRNRRAMGEEYPDEVDALLEPWLMAKTRAEIFEACQANRVPVAPVRTIDEVVNDPHLRGRDYFVEVDRAETGIRKYPGAPYKFSKAPWRISRPAPLLGEHDEGIYCHRLGYSKEELAQLRKAGVI